MSDLSLLGVAREPKILLVIDFYNLKASIAESLGTGIWKFNPDVRRFTEILFGTKVSEYVKIKIVTKIIKTDKSIALISALENIPNCVPYYPDEKDFFDNWDDEMIKIILRDERTCDYDIVCLVSGDGTFYSPLQELLAMGKKAFIISRIGNINKCYLENEELIIIDYSNRIKEFIIYPDTTKTTPVDESKDPLLTFEMLGIANPNKTKTITSVKKPNDFKEPKIDMLTNLLNSKKWLKFGNLSKLLLQFCHSIANSSDDIEDIMGLLYSEFNKIPGLKINLIINELTELTSNLRKERTNIIAEIRNLKNRFALANKYCYRNVDE